MSCNSKVFWTKVLEVKKISLGSKQLHFEKSLRKKKQSGNYSAPRNIICRVKAEKELCPDLVSVGSHCNNDS